MNIVIAVLIVNAVPMTLLSIWAFSNYNAMNVLRFVVSLMMIGSLLRAVCFWNDRFWPVVIGSYISNCCNAFFINVQAIIANKWFTDKERALATAI